MISTFGNFAERPGACYFQTWLAFGTCPEVTPYFEPNPPFKVLLEPRGSQIDDQDKTVIVADLHRELSLVVDGKMARVESRGSAIREARQLDASWDHQDVRRHDHLSPNDEGYFGVQALLLGALGSESGLGQTMVRGRHPMRSLWLACSLVFGCAAGPQQAWHIIARPQLMITIDNENEDYIGELPMEDEDAKALELYGLATEAVAKQDWVEADHLFDALDHYHGRANMDLSGDRALAAYNVGDYAKAYRLSRDAQLALPAMTPEGRAYLLGDLRRIERDAKERIGWLGIRAPLGVDFLVIGERNGVSEHNYWHASGGGNLFPAMPGTYELHFSNGLLATKTVNAEVRLGEITKLTIEVVR